MGNFKTFLENYKDHSEGQARVDAFIKDFYQRFPALAKYQNASVVYIPQGMSSKHGTHPEASCQPRCIEIYDKFFNLLNNPGVADFTFAHELGHWALQKSIGLYELSQMIDIWNNIPYGQNNGEEAFADCFAEYFMNRHDLERRYPKWAKMVEFVYSKS